MTKPITEIIAEIRSDIAAGGINPQSNIALLANSHDDQAKEIAELKDKLTRERDEVLTMLGGSERRLHASH